MQRSLRNDVRWTINRERSDLLIREATRKIRNGLGIDSYFQRKSAILITGSIARKEAGTYSELGIMLLHRGLDKEDLSRIAEGIGRFALTSTGTVHMVKGMTGVDISSKAKRPVFYFDILGELGYQNILEGTKVYGSDPILAEAKRMIIGDLTSAEINTSVSGGLIQHTEALVEQMGTGKRVVKNALVIDYDLQAGVCSYAPGGKGNEPKSFKAPILAAHSWIVQNLALLAISNPAHAARMVMSLPSNTVDKLDYIASSARLSVPTGVIADLADSYLFFLKKFQMSQHEANQGHKNVLFDISEVKERLFALGKILSGPLF